MCSGISTTSADVNAYTYDSSKKIITISLYSNEDGNIQLSIPHTNRQYRRICRWRRMG